MARTSEIRTFSQCSQSFQQISNIFTKRCFRNNLKKCFLVLIKGGSCNNCIFWNLIFILRNPLNKPLFFKREPKECFKIVMLIYANECIPFTRFCCLSIVSQCLGKSFLVRPPKTCKKIKLWKAWNYKRVGLWTVKIQISKVKKQFKLLFPKNVRQNVFNLSSSRSVAWSLNF